MIRIAVVQGSFLLLACKYSSPDPAVSNTSTQSPSSTHDSTESTETPHSTESSAAQGTSTKGTPEEAKRAPTEASGSCDDRSCVASSDCCGGFECGFDPERSKVQRYCLKQ
jgi:hypothetical protein